MISCKIFESTGESSKIGILVPSRRDNTYVLVLYLSILRYKSNESIDRFKTRFVAKVTVGVVLTLTIHFGWDLHQLDVKNTFLHMEI